VTSAYEIEVVVFAKLGHDLRAERDGNTANAVRPPGDGFLRIGPEKVAKEAYLMEKGGREREAKGGRGQKEKK